MDVSVGEGEAAIRVGPAGWGEKRPAAWSVAGSVLVHAAFAALIVLGWQMARLLPLPVETPVRVTVMSPQDFEQAVAPSTGEDSDPLPEEAPPDEEPSPGLEETEMIEATSMLSARVLDLPDNHATRDQLRDMEDTERMIQICDLEAMEQIHAWRETFRPERLVAYASEEVTVTSKSVSAEGAAFRSAGQWYALRFDCDLSPDHQEVEGLRFAVGDPIPRDEWETRGLAEKY